MALRIEAIKTLQARIRQGKTANMQDVTAHMTRRTTLSPGEVWMQFIELQEAIIWFASEGRAVKIEGLGTFTPVLRQDRRFHLNFRADVGLKIALNKTGAFSGKIVNRNNLGKSATELEKLWNELHPDNPKE